MILDTQHRKIQLDQFLHEFERAEDRMTIEQYDLIVAQVQAMATALLMLDGIAGDTREKAGIEMSPKEFYRRSRVILHHVLGVEDIEPAVEKEMVEKWYEASHVQAWRIWSKGAWA